MNDSARKSGSDPDFGRTSGVTPRTPATGPGYFDHGASIGVIGRGATLAEAFVHAADATFALMCNTDAVVPRQRIDIEFTEADRELALVTWLNELLTNATARGLALGRFALVNDGHRWRGSARGEPWYPGLARGVQLKGATRTALKVARAGDVWEARCVVER